MNKIALITGATSGIGRAVAIRLAQEGINLILCGRRTERLEELKTLLEKQVKIHTLSFDISDQQAVESALNSLPKEWKAIDYLINNAGNAHGLSPVQDGNIRDWDAMLDINVKGLLYVSRNILPAMIARQNGHVINIGSIAGKETYPNGNVYCASKAAVQAITDGMRMDLNPHGIKVTGIHPGLVETEFSVVRFKGDEERAKNVYKGIDPLTADDIADTIAFVLSRPSHVVLADIVILPTAQASATIVNRK
ncbi:SDR family NAD(P)-dependent oxidoreductase [Cytophagaceae bacterium DM2B3-1]|uniref:SDR family NAD(P)-dependent oxidoreductase n=1 Tax=Xanthocytophaga flava TaxID=3048013 RepID=A0ABT7CI57_9BACT|nr:SDR family NAD(P)-dependent oxidoreductase [Xanthocytophaga flavus]MDJ1493362.1 SDR family NAD(P)-dependent oxidoreductase [Xanthocytophaga flavus]